MVSGIKFWFVISLPFLISAQETCRTIDNQIGQCVPIRSCSPVEEVYKKFPVRPPTVESYLRSYQCGSKENFSEICCPPKPIYFDEYTDNNYFNLLTEPPDISNHRNIELLPKDCGHLSSSDRIIGGEEAGLFEFPWMAMLLYRDGDSLVPKCGGTIINNRYILTAAHCLIETLAMVRVGEFDIRNKTDCQIIDDVKKCAPPYQDLIVEEAIRYGKYNRSLHHHDIAILRVSPIDLSRNNSRPVCLPLGENKNFNFTNKYGVVSGWGFTTHKSFHTLIPSPILMKVSVPAVSLEKCFGVYKNIQRSIRLYERQLCAGGEKGKDSCVGDSGGPLHFSTYLNGDYRLVQQGMVSYGYGCGQKDVPGVYVRVAYFLDWILDNMKP